MSQTTQKQKHEQYLPAKEILFGEGSINVWAYFMIHLVAFSLLAYLPWSWRMWQACIFSYYLRMFAITGGYHRYFSHRSYSTGRLFQFLLASLGSASVQKGVLWWASHHRHHHKHADGPDDIHSPTRSGFLWSHCGWFLLSSKYAETNWKYIPDLKIYPELVLLNTYHWVPAVLYAACFYLWGGWEGVYWGFFLSTVLLWHGTYTINSLSHMFGSVRYSTTDTSKNNPWLAILTLGEGWHNNHHTYMSSANQGFFWWEFDPTFWVLRVLEALGLVSNLRFPPLEKLDAKRVDRKEEEVM